MAYRAKKMEHAGAKKGSGAYWGPKRDTKRESNRRRRRNDTIAVKEETGVRSSPESPKATVPAGQSRP